MREVEREVAATPSLTLQTRIIEVPVWYDDPWTNETAAKFRDRHQRPEGNDLEFARSRERAVRRARNSSTGTRAHRGSPRWSGSWPACRSSTRWCPRERQLQVPKYLRPRTDTPPLTVGHGGCFACIYSVRGAGGYQMFGVTPAPIFDPTQQLADFADFMVFFRPGDLVKFTGIDEARVRRRSARRSRPAPSGSARNPWSSGSTTSTPRPTSYNASLLEALDGS